MAERRSYKATLFDREGPDAGIRIKAYTYAAMAGGLSVIVFALLGVMYQLKPLPFLALVVLGPIVTTIGIAKLSMRAMSSVEQGAHVILAGGSSTPYTQQHSYQQALVMQGRLDEALESLEAIIADPESSTVDVRIRAAELYAREAKKPQRAAELLREASRHPNCTPGEEVYAVNRLADLLTGPLADPGRALVELRRLADRYAGTAVSERAKESIRVMKSGGPVDLYKAAESSEA